MWSTLFQHPPLLGSQPLLKREIPWLCHGPAGTSSLLLQKSGIEAQSQEVHNITNTEVCSLWEGEVIL